MSRQDWSKTGFNAIKAEIEIRIEPYVFFRIRSEDLCVIEAGSRKKVQEIMRKFGKVRRS
jgi:hypothetical protein